MSNDQLSGAELARLREMIDRKDRRGAGHDPQRRHVPHVLSRHPQSLDHLDGDAASVVVAAVDALLHTAPRPADPVAGCRLIQHGLRYTDELVRTLGGWRIRERHLVCLWQHIVVPPLHGPAFLKRRRQRFPMTAGI